MVHWLDRVLALLQADTADLRELARIAGGDPKTFYRGIQLRDLDVDGQNIEGMEFASTPNAAAQLLLDLSDAGVKNMIKQGKKRGFVTFDQLNEVLPSHYTTVEQIEDIMSTLSDMGINVEEGETESIQERYEILQKIRTISRQEERLAVLFEEIIQNHEKGVAALLNYQHDRAKFATNALSLIREKILANQNYVTDEFIVACLISRLYKDAFPFNRGPLLYFLAKHLSKYPTINQTLRQRLDKSNSASVHRVRREIDQMLRLGSLLK